MNNNGLSGMFEGLSAWQKYLNEHSSFTEELTRIINSPAMVAAQSAADTMRSVLPTIELNHLAQIQSAIPQLSPALISAAGMASKLTYEVSAFTNESIPTSAISALQKSLVQGSYLQGINEFAESFSAASVPTQNLALLKSSSAMLESLSGKLPNGLPTVIKRMHTGTAKGIKDKRNFQYSNKERVFHSQSTPDDTATVSELNVISSTADFFKELTEEELISFMCAVQNARSVAMVHDTGKKIMDIIKNIGDHIGFDRERYYHARPLGGEDDSPYTHQEMCAAPVGRSTRGRFNWEGDSHYYFSDKIEGATSEIRKHDRSAKIIQVAEIAPLRKGRFLDFSQDGTHAKNNYFLTFLRRPLKSATRREYLVPCFVGDCCLQCGYDGIKYYGSKEYQNYVTWTDGFFEFVSETIQRY